MSQTKLPRILAFDVFGTVVDWRTSIARESAVFLPRIGLKDVDPEAFTDAWRIRYIGAMAAFRDSQRSFASLDILHREMLDDVLRDAGAAPESLDAELLDDWNRSWHRLDAWPDSVAGLTRLKAMFPIITLTNGNVALMLAMARRAGLPWDALLGAEFTRAYKPDPRAYLGTVEALGISPNELCLVASHHSDLAAARACGLQTAYVNRPKEYGEGIAPDANAKQDWEWCTDSIADLADQLGC